MASDSYASGEVVEREKPGRSEPLQIEDAGPFEAFAKGDSLVWNRAEPALLRLARHVIEKFDSTINDANQKDLVQRAIIELHPKLETMAGWGVFVGHFCEILEYRTKDDYRKRSRSVPIDESAVIGEDGADIVTEENASHLCDLNRVQRAIDRLEPKDRELWDLQTKLSLSELANHYKIEKSTAQSRVDSLQKRIRVLFEKV
jgi:RNA polymerase sigma factor (sigma-70 family)